MQAITDFDFVPLVFDENGALQNAGQMTTLEEHARSATDVIFLAHGFRNNEDDATGLYAAFLQTLKKNLARAEFQASLGTRKFVVAGVYWPSKSFQESFPDEAVEAQVDALKLEVDATAAAKLDEAKALLPQIEENPGAQDSFVASVLSVLSKTTPDATEGLDRIRSQNGSDLLQKLRMPLLPSVPGAPGDADGGGGVAAAVAVGGAFSEEGGTQAFGGFLGSVLGAVGKFLNMTTWYIMKNRSGVVGSTGVAQAVRNLKASQPAIRIHLAGHSLGGRLMAACTKALAQDPQLKPASLMLMEAAFSHYGFSDNNGDGVAGFFRDVIDKHAVIGPMVSTYSYQDSVVGLVYAVASRLADDNVKAIGDANDPFGGIGRNGCQKTTESCEMKLKAAGGLEGSYVFQSGKVNCLDGSGGLIKDHSDITNESVTYAFAAVLAAT